MKLTIVFVKGIQLDDVLYNAVWFTKFLTVAINFTVTFL